MWSARIGGDHCVVADTWNGLFVVNVADVKSPKTVAHAILPVPDGKTEPDPVGGEPDKEPGTLSGSKEPDMEPGTGSMAPSQGA